MPDWIPIITIRNADKISLRFIFCYGGKKKKNYNSLSHEKIYRLRIKPIKGSFFNNYIQFMTILSLEGIHFYK